MQAGRICCGSGMTLMASGNEQRRAQFIRHVELPKKAEFINEQIFIPDPARWSEMDASINTMVLLSQHATLHELGEVYAETCLIRCRRNDYKPDVCFYRAARVVGWNDDKDIFPPPDLIVEVLSPSTARNDRTVKFQDYAAHGVSEYWIIDADAQTVEQYTLPPGATAYTLHARVEKSGRLVSPTLPGFDVPAAALFDARENQRVQTTLSQG